MTAKRKIVNNHLNMIRNINTMKILNAVFKNDSISRIELSKITELSPTTVTNIVEKLEMSGWLYEESEGVSNGGRKPIMLSMNKRKRFVLAIQVNREFIKGAIYNLEPLEVYRIEKKVTYLGNKIIDILLDAIAGLLEYAKNNQFDILALGLSIPGIVNVKSGILVYSTDLELENLCLKRIIEEKFTISVYMQNDANIEALAEKTYGVAKNENMMVYIKDLGGAGIIINGEIYLGFNGAAGEFGHISIDKNGEKCKCGNYGCLYQYVSKMAIEANVIKAIKQGRKTKLNQGGEIDFNKITLEEIIKSANEGDELSKSVLKDVAENLGVAIVSLVGILDIRFIVIGGLITKAGDYFYNTVMDTFRTRTSKMSFKNVRIEKSTLDEDLGLLGCVCLVLKETFKIPLN